MEGDYYAGGTKGEVKKRIPDSIKTVCKAVVFIVSLLVCVAIYYTC